MSTTLARIRAFLRYPSLSALAHDESVIRRAGTLVMLYYAILPFVAYMFFKAWHVPLTRANFEPLWPLAWVDWFAVSDDMTVTIVRSLFLVTSLAALLLYRHWWARAAVFLGLWQAHALSSSFGSINHELYPWLYVSFMLIFLPPLSGARAASYDSRRQLLLIVWSAQAFIMLLYTMAGFWKIGAAIAQFSAGEIHGFSFYAFAYQVADWVPRLQKEAVLAPFIVAYPLLAWPFYVGSHLFQFFALWTMVRPSLHKLWGYELVLFHIGTLLVMGIEFDTLILLVTVLFIFSPFIPANVSWRQIFFDLPVIGQIAEWYKRRRS